MAKKEPVDPVVEDAVQKILAICNSLTREQCKLLAARVDETPGALDDITFWNWCNEVISRTEIAKREAKLPRNVVKPDGLALKKMLWEEKYIGKKKWPEMTADHAPMTYNEIRAHVRSFDEMIKDGRVKRPLPE